MIRLMRYLKPYALQVAGVLILTLAGVFSELLLPRLMGNIVDRGVATGDLKYIYRTGGVMLAIAILGTAATVISRYMSSKAAVAFGRDLRSDVFKTVESFSLNEIDKMGTSSLITRTTNDVSQMQNITIMSMRMMIRAPFMMIGGIIMATSTNLELSKVLLISAPVLVVVIWIIGAKGFPLFKEIQKKIDDLNRVLRESLTGIRVIKAFNKTDYEKKRFNQANRDLTDAALKVGRIMALMMPILNVVLNFTLVGVIWYGSSLIEIRGLEVGELMAFIQYVSQIMFSLIMVSMIFVMLPRASASAERINEVLDMESDIIDGSENIEDNSIRGELRLDDVAFKYQDASTPAVEDITFATKMGETTAIIGGTGSGKTTILNLLMRFYDPTGGRILINGADIKTIHQEELRSRFGLVSQKAVLFTGTIRENITFGKEDATDEEIVESLKIAQAWDFVSEKEEGLDYVLAQGGRNLSGGQKQRLAIARALVRKPEFYLFDDSFSALDFSTDKRLRDALKPYTADSAVIVVAQRVSTIKDAENIIVLDNGRISGQGTHRELIESCQVYREIVLSQLGEEAIK
ncbi:ABC transporter ATP-binding protein [Gudongella oleilytica]|uniref:ABC transporter ATP-binding protein n=1 Tax=Gudongella oleilytica TaxID=1582259 RepID=UPI002A36676E|nr:ABC transporter ATP-binding protein [Gudongella oleilytica]MDY0257808.1 ABC transporter ATP-binding protein [Gudongella oleilytica]